MSVNATIVGNLTADPTYRVGSNNKGYCFATVAENIKGRDGNDDRTNFHRIKLYDGKNGLAKKFCDTFKKGQRVIASGIIETFNEPVFIEDEDGGYREVERTVSQLVVFNVGPDILFQDVTVAKSARRYEPDDEAIAERSRSRKSADDGFDDSDEAPAKPRRTRAKKKDAEDFEAGEF